MSRRICKMVLGVILLFTTPVFADCVDLSNYTRWDSESPPTIYFYEGVRPAGGVQITGCRIRPMSRVRLIDSYVCDGDEIIIDGDTCTIFRVTILY